MKNTILKIAFLFSPFSGFCVPRKLVQNKDTVKVKDIFELSVKKRESFWNTTVINAINNELAGFKRAKSDTAFVYIEEAYDKNIFSYLLIKNNRQFRAFYMLFKGKSQYYIVELKTKILNMGSFGAIYNLVIDRDFTKSDFSPGVFAADDAYCHYYFGIGHRSREKAAMGSNLIKDTSLLLGFLHYYKDNLVYTSQDEWLYDYFDAESFKDKKLPETVKNFRLVRKNGNKK